MALDGGAISNIVHEPKEKALGGRVDKIYLPEKDEVIFSIRSLGNSYKFLLSANSSHPRAHFTNLTKNNPMQPPLFCMVLRKHINGGKIVDVVQPNFERILEVHIESLNEMGDMSTKRLIIEIMGKHSNIILVNDAGIILDSAKHITLDTSSVRQILPGLKYVLPPSKDKLDPMCLEQNSFYQTIKQKSGIKLQSSIYQSYNGISPILSSEICFLAGVDADVYGEAISNLDLSKVYCEFEKLVNNIKAVNFSPEIIYDDKEKLIEFSSVPLSIYTNNVKENYDSISELLEFFYSEKDNFYRMGQKTVDIKKLIQLNIERCVKKKDVHIKTLRDIKNRDELKIWGELITSNIYAIEKGMTSLTTQNFYDENLSDITIPLDANLTPVENAQKYFKRYSKEKRTFQALQEQMKQNEEELNYLEGVLSAVASCSDEADIEEIREELAEQGFIKKRKLLKGGQKQKKSKPLHYVSSDGFDIYVGKNNKQNDELTLKFAEAYDIWFHTKEIPGSHVIIKTVGQTPPDTTLNEAANLAAFYSKARNGSHVPVDYTIKKNVKKPNGVKPGMVIYDNYKTAYITPNEKFITSLTSDTSQLPKK